MLKLKHYFISAFFLLEILFIHQGCTLRETIQEESNNITDSTFVEEWATMYIDSAIIDRDELELLPLSHYEKAIRIRSKGGWGNFDAIATFYLQEDRYLVQTVTQEHLPRNFRRSYTYKEFTLAKREWEEIDSRLDADGFWQSPFDLEPEVMVLDGDTYSIAAFFTGRSHVTTWQLSEKQEPAAKLKILKLFEYLVLKSKRPAPCVTFYFDSIRQGSIYYASHVPEWAIVDSIAFDCDNCTTTVDDYGRYTVAKLLDTSKYNNTNERIAVRFFTPFRRIREVDCKIFTGPTALEYFD